MYNKDLTEESRKIAFLCGKVWSDYDLELLIGQTYFKEHNYRLAQQYFKRSSNMCPCRFAPLYLQFQVYLKLQEYDRALELAEIIDAKNIKISSPYVLSIKRRIRSFIKNQTLIKNY